MLFLRKRILKAQPTPRHVFSGFRPKTAWPLQPTLSVHQCDSFVTPDLIVSNRNLLTEVEEVKQKALETMKGVSIDTFKGPFEQWKKTLDKNIAKWMIYIMLFFLRFRSGLVGPRCLHHASFSARATSPFRNRKQNHTMQIRVQVESTLKVRENGKC